MVCLCKLEVLYPRLCNLVLCVYSILLNGVSVFAYVEDVSFNDVVVCFFVVLVCCIVFTNTPTVVVGGTKDTHAVGCV